MGIKTTMLHLWPLRGFQVEKPGTQLGRRIYSPRKKAPDTLELRVIEAIFKANREGLPYWGEHGLPPTQPCSARLP